MLRGQLVMVDFDSVINDFDKKCIAWFNARNGTSYEQRDVTTWNWVRKQPGSDVFWKVTFHDPGFTLSLAPLAGAFDALKKLMDAGADTHVVSARPQKHRGMVTEWFVDHGLRPGIGFKLDFSSDKARYFYNRGGLVWFDDGPHNAKKLAEYAPGYLIDMPYNEKMPPTRHSIMRVATLKQGVDNLITIGAGVERYLNAG